MFELLLYLMMVTFFSWQNFLLPVRNLVIFVVVLGVLYGFVTTQTFNGLKYTRCFWSVSTFFFSADLLAGTHIGELGHLSANGDKVMSCVVCYVPLAQMIFFFDVC
jgi:hypothetical protein